MFSKSTIKYIQSLQHKKFREEYGSFVAEGPKVVSELLDGNYFECEQVYCTNDWPGKDQQSLSGNLTIIKDFELEKISALSQPNQVVAVFKQKAPPGLPAVNDKISLVLDDIRDPGNFGTIIRIADWFGIENIICSLNTADQYNSKVVQSTMASLGRVNIYYTDLSQWLPRVSLRKYAATLGGKDLHAIGKIKEGILIIGNESHGIGENVMALADEQITIARIGAAESLNAAVATGIILFSLAGK